MKYPSLYQVNTRVWLTRLSTTIGRKATLDDIPEQDLDWFAAQGFSWIWLLSVWCTGEKGRRISREHPGWRKDFEATLPDLKEEDIGGSGFAIAAYEVSPDIGGNDALRRFRERLSQRGLKLMLDFVPNHMGPDHPWVESHPEYFVSGTAQDLEHSPQNFFRCQTTQGDTILAYGRDPYFDGWPDTVQLDYSNPVAVAAMKAELLRIADQCDGLRCDMSMLVLPEIFERTWGRKAMPFWPEAIGEVKRLHPGFCFMAEVYWDLEWEMQQQGFDYAYDKRLYDRLEHGQARAIQEHFLAGMDYQDKLARFLENHDEPRAAKVFEGDRHKAAAVITFLSPGLRFFHQGQFEGHVKRISPHLVRGPVEPVIEGIRDFYLGLLKVLRDPLFNNGQWQFCPVRGTSDGQRGWDSIIVFAWHGSDGRKGIVAVNYSAETGQCIAQLPFDSLAGTTVRLQERMVDAHYDWDGSVLQSEGLFLKLPPWGYHIFELSVK